MWILILATIGILLTALLSVLFVHELGHYLRFKQDGVPIMEFVILGWKENVTNGFEGIGWVQHKANYDPTWHRCWDFNLTACRELI